MPSAAPAAASAPVYCAWQQVIETVVPRRRALSQGASASAGPAREAGRSSGRSRCSAAASAPRSSGTAAAGSATGAAGVRSAFCNSQTPMFPALAPTPPELPGTFEWGNKEESAGLYLFQCREEHASHN